MKTFIKFLIWIYSIIIFILPIVTIFIYLISSSWLNIFSDKIFISSLNNSLFIALITTILSILVGSSAGFFISRVSIPFGKLLLYVLSLPILFVPYQFALSWSFILRSGFLSKLLFSKLGVIFILTGCFYPVAMWLTFIGFYSIPTEEEESALMIHHPKKIFFKIVLRKVFPYILTSALLIFFLCFSEMGVPTYLGVDVLPYEILIQFSAFYNLKRAFWMCIPMAMIGFLIFICEYFILKRGLKFYQKFSEKKPIVFSNRLLVWIASGLLFIYIIIFILIPIFNLIYKSLDFNSLKIVINGVSKNLILTIFYSILVSTVCAIWALLANYFGEKIEKVFFSFITLFLFFLPSQVIAVALIYIWKNVNFIYGSFILLLIGLIIKFTFFSYKIIETAFERLDKSSYEVALLTGANHIKIITKIIFSEIRNWFFVGFMIVFVFCMNELGLSSILYPPGGEPITVKLYTLSVNNPSNVSSSIALLNSITTLIFVYFIMRFGYEKQYN